MVSIFDRRKEPTIGPWYRKQQAACLRNLQSLAARPDTGNPNSQGNTTLRRNLNRVAVVMLWDARDHGPNDYALVPSKKLSQKLGQGRAIAGALATGGLESTYRKPYARRSFMARYKSVCRGAPAKGRLCNGEYCLRHFFSQTLPPRLSTVRGVAGSLFDIRLLSRR
jgi:hypothetical protein